MSNLRFTVCIPSYNRAVFLPALLDSIMAQDFKSFNILVCEDNSPERCEIQKIVSSYQEYFPGVITYLENNENLGYDKNLRKLLENSVGEYTVFMGNDDLMCAGALTSINESISLDPSCAVVIRSYASFDKSPLALKQIYRYFPNKKLISPGVEAITLAYRRAVVISGMTFKTIDARAIATCKFDGTLLYQLYLVGMLLANKSVVFSPDIVVLRRDGVSPDFGNSESERGKFVPNDQTPDSSIYFIRGMLDIALHINTSMKVPVFKKIQTDIGNYSYPILSIQARKSPLIFFKYCFDLAKMGFWKNQLFYLYVIGLFTIGPNNMDVIIKFIKNKLGYTPFFSMK